MDALSAEVQSYLSRRFDEEGGTVSDRPTYWKWAWYYLDFYSFCHFIRLRLAWVLYNPFPHHVPWGSLIGIPVVSIQATIKLGFLFLSKPHFLRHLCNGVPDVFNELNAFSDT